eukprot:13016832-Alexandrium_andersonii.AAC.1
MQRGSGGQGPIRWQHHHDPAVHRPAATPHRFKKLRMLCSSWNKLLGCGPYLWRGFVGQKDPGPF